MGTSIHRYIQNYWLPADTFIYRELDGFIIKLNQVVGSYEHKVQQLCG
jgi:hypothetical protein